MLRPFFLAAVICVCGGSRTAAEAPPNIVLILADDMGWGDAGYHGFNDIVPTLLSTISDPHPHSRTHTLRSDGVNLLRYLNGEKQGRPHDLFTWRSDNDYAIRQGDWKLTWNDASGSANIMLFNLANDPGEFRDVAAQHPAKAQALQELFDQWDDTLPDHVYWGGPWNRQRYREKPLDVAEFSADDDKGNIRRKIRP